MILQLNADIQKASQRDLVDTLNALPAGEVRRYDIRAELSRRVLVNMTRQRAAKQRAAQLRARVKADRVDRATIAKAAQIDLSTASLDQLREIAFTTDDAAQRQAALMEAAKRWLKQAPTAGSKPKPQVVPVEAEKLDPAGVNPKVIPGKPIPSPDGKPMPGPDDITKARRLCAFCHAPACPPACPGDAAGRRLAKHPRR